MRMQKVDPDSCAVPTARPVPANQSRRRLCTGARRHTLATTTTSSESAMLTFSRRRSYSIIFRVPGRHAASVHVPERRVADFRLLVLHCRANL